MKIGKSDCYSNIQQDHRQIRSGNMGVNFMLVDKGLTETPYKKMLMLAFKVSKNPNHYKLYYIVLIHTHPLEHLICFD